jgi:agmatinase
MVKSSLLVFVTGLVLCDQAFVAQGTQTLLGERPDPTWREKYGGQLDQPFSGPLSFSHLPYALCLQDETAMFDIAILGMPFDTSVSYRTGCDFSC